MVQYIRLLIQILNTKATPYDYTRCPRPVSNLCDQSALECAAGRYDSAIQLANAAICAGPEYVEGYEAVANVYITQMQPGKALKALNYAISHFPTASCALTLMGFLLGESGQLREAIKMLQLALHYDPKSYEALRHTGWYLHELGDAVGSEAMLLRALTVSEGMVGVEYLYLDLANLYLSRNDKARATDFYDRAARLLPADHLELGRLRGLLRPIS